MPRRTFDQAFETEPLAFAAVRGRLGKSSWFLLVFAGEVEVSPLWELSFDVFCRTSDVARKASKDCEMSQGVQSRLQSGDTRIPHEPAAVTVVRRGQRLMNLEKGIPVGVVRRASPPTVARPDRRCGSNRQLKATLSGPIPERRWVLALQ